jgi:hypothetical protein
VQLFGQPEVNLGEVDEHGHEGRRSRMAFFSLRNSRQMRGRWRTTSVRPITAISSERTTHSRPASAMRSPPMPKKLRRLPGRGEPLFERGDQQRAVVLAAGLACRDEDRGGHCKYVLCYSALSRHWRQWELAQSHRMFPKRLCRISRHPRIVQGTLIAPGSVPFHLKATITAGSDPSSVATVEMDWDAPTRWRRTIDSREFSQTLIVNGDKVFEANTGNYFPLGLRTLVTAMVDPKPLLDAYRPGDLLQTKANGASDESGRTCYDADRKICGKSRLWLAGVCGRGGALRGF